VGLGSPEHKIDEEMCWHGRNISPQVHRVTRSKRKSKSYSKHDKVIWQDQNQKAYKHRKGRNRLGRKTRAFPQATPSLRKDKRQRT